MIAALRQLGFQRRRPTGRIRARCHVSARSATTAIPAAAADLFVANSGTTMRFLTALVSLGHGRYRLDGVPRMRERPIDDLLAALRQLGVNAYERRGNGCPPGGHRGRRPAGGQRPHQGRRQQSVPQRPAHGRPVRRAATSIIEVDGPLVSRPYVDMTVRMMRPVAPARQHADRRARSRCPAQQPADGLRADVRHRTGRLGRQLFLRRRRHHRRPRHGRPA